MEFDADPFGLDDDIPQQPRGAVLCPSATRLPIVSITAENVLDRLGGRGGMSAAAGGSMLFDGERGSSRTKIRFQEGKSQ